MVSTRDCLFCKIIRNEISSKKVYEDSKTLVILDINPASKGHMLVMPKTHSETIYDVSQSDLDATIGTVKKMCDVAKMKLEPDGINVLQNNGQHAGQIIAHMHFHVVPRYKDDKIIIGFPRTQTDESQLNEVLRELKSEVAEEQEEREEIAEEEKRETQEKNMDFAPRRERKSEWDF